MSPRLNDLPVPLRNTLRMILAGAPIEEDDAFDLARAGLLTWGEPWAWTETARAMFKADREERRAAFEKKNAIRYFRVKSGGQRWHFTDGDAAVAFARERARPPFHPRGSVDVGCYSGTGSMEAVVWISDGGNTERWANNFREGGLSAQVAERLAREIEYRRSLQQRSQEGESK